MKKSICERILGAVLVVTIPAEFVGVMGMESDTGAWAWWLCVACAVLQLTAIVAVKVTAERDKRREAIRVPHQLIHRGKVRK